MGSCKDWPLISERVFRVRGRPGRLAVIAMSLVSVALFLSIVGLQLNGRFDSVTLDFSLVLSSIAAILFFGVFGWGAAFLKCAYYKTLEQLNFKSDELKTKYLEKEIVYSETHAIVGFFITYGALAIALWTWPLFNPFFPLTIELLPFFLLIVIFMALAGLLGVDSIGAIPNLLRLPAKLKEDIQIVLLRPDRCGGAKAIGDFYFVFTLLVASIGSLTIVISRSFGISIIGYGMAISFMILALLVFVLPQLSIREILRKEKLKKLEEISDKVEDLSISSESPDSEDLLVSFIHVQSLIMLYGEIEKLREFPFEIGTLQKVVSTALIPLVLEIIFNLFILPSIIP